MAVFSFLLFMDLDEMLVPQHAHTWPQLLSQLFYPHPNHHHPPDFFLSTQNVSNSKNTSTLHGNSSRYNPTADRHYSKSILTDDRHNVKGTLTIDQQPVKDRRSTKNALSHEENKNTPYSVRNTPYFVRNPPHSAKNMPYSAKDTPYSEKNTPGLDMRSTAVLSFRSAFFDPTRVPEEAEDIVYFQHLHRTKAVSLVRNKMMVQPGKVFELGIHHLSKPLTEGYKSADVDQDVALLHHYRACAYDYEPCMKCYPTRKDKTILRYKEELTQRSHRVINDAFRLFA
jgi:hypothetical protein